MYSPILEVGSFLLRPSSQMNSNIGIQNQVQGLATYRLSFRL